MIYMFQFGCGWFRVVFCPSSFLFFLLCKKLFQKNKRKVGSVFGDIFFFKTPLKFLEMLLYYVLEIPHKTRFHPGISVKLCQLHSLKIPEPKTKATGNSFFIIIITPRKFHVCFLTNLWEFRILLMRDSWKLHVVHPLLCLFFFLEYPNYVREGTQDKLEIYLITIYKSYILQWKAKVLGKSSQ